MQIIEERFRKGEKGSGWDAFARMMESDAGKELGKEALETVWEIFRTTRSGGKEEGIQVHRRLSGFDDETRTLIHVFGDAKPTFQLTPLLHHLRQPGNYLV